MRKAQGVWGEREFIRNETPYGGLRASPTERGTRHRRHMLQFCTSRIKRAYEAVYSLGCEQKDRDNSTASLSREGGARAAAAAAVAKSERGSSLGMILKLKRELKGRAKARVGTFKAQGAAVQTRCGRT